ncbi:MAG: hypothetical protein JW749_07260 [Sedimentisphaerales bacterium]|nr:hypothetical protein [Sedimentisphaerales bacterium]
MAKLKAIKKDIQTQKYAKFYSKLQKLLYRFPKDKSFSTQDRQHLSLCLAELYFKSNHLNKVIKKISETNLKLDEKHCNSITSNLIDLQIDIYTEMVDWIKDLKKLLKTLINIIENSDPEKRTFIAETNVRISMKRANSLLKKIEYYYPPKKNRNKRKQFNSNSNRT